MHFLRHCIFLSFMFLTACGFHLRGHEAYPATLKTIYLETRFVNSEIETSITRYLQANGVRLVSSEKLAPITLLLSNSREETELPVIFNNNASSNFYYLSIHFSLIAKNKKIIIPDTRIVVSKAITYNVNQIADPLFTPVIRRELIRDLVSSMDTLLTSINTQVVT